jgi:uncharacterized protein YkwD
MFIVAFLACQDQSALQGVGYGHYGVQSGEEFPDSERLEGIDTSDFEFLPEELEVSVEVNFYRQELDLPPMTLYESFSVLAREHSEAMAAGEVLLGHVGFMQRYQWATSVSRITAGAENVGMNFASEDPALMAVEGWLNSEGHLDNIKGDYNMTGVGVAVDEDGMVYLTQLFFLGQMY